MRSVFRVLLPVLGLISLATALAILAGDLWRWWRDDGFAATPLGEAWFALDSFSLNLMQAVIQRYVADWLWDPAIVWVLLQPATAVLGLFGFLLLLLTPEAPRQRRRGLS